MSLALIALLGAACDGSAAPPTGSTPSTRELLAAPVEFAFDTPGSAVAVTARPLLGGGVTHRVALRVPDGSMTLRADAAGALVLEQLAVELDDIDISAGSLPPAGLHLTDLRVTVEQVDPAEASWSADGVAALSTVAADLTIAWSLVSDGRVVPLAPQRIRGVELQVEVGPAAAGGVAVTVRGGLPGAFLRPAGVFELSDLTVELVTAS